MRRVPLLIIAGAVLAFGIAVAPRHLVSRPAVTTDFVHFESPHVHPAALTPGGNRLLVVNTPDNRLTVFDLTQGAPSPLTRIAEIPVGMEPVSVAARSDSEAWVVNLLSDDVSIVNLNTLHVRASVRVGDEPADVVFAGSPERAYVSVSQHDLVRVLDPGTLTQVAVIPIQGRMPRALARTADGSKVYVAVFNAGNRTSVLSEAEAGDSLPPPNPPMSPSLPAAPKVGLIIQQQNGDWRDETGRLWNDKAKYSLAEVDIAEIATASNTVSRTFSDLGTINFGLAVNGSGTIAMSATEARNLTRFEPNLSGHLVDTRLALVTAGGSASTVNLNPHVNYAVTPGPPSDADSAIGIPAGVAWSSDGARVYVTSLTSNRLGVLDASGTIHARCATLAGPDGVVVDDAHGRLYVTGRFHNELQTLSSATLQPLGTTAIGFDPTPDAIVNGRKFFYGGFTSGHGEEACATCHVFGDFDNIAWDLGNPQGTMQPINRSGQVDPAIASSVHPMKGPMATQSLRGLPPTGMFHWRADRNNLDAFNPAFISLMGRATELPDSEMAAFDDFVLPLSYPPNPNEFLNRTLPDAPAGVASAVRGRTFFMTQATDGAFLRCNDCHSAGTNFGPGTNGQIINHTALQEAQDMKVPQLRNLYKKSGFTNVPGAVAKRGFGYTHNGAVANLFDFLHFPGFTFPGGDPQRRDVEAFLLTFDTGIAPAVGFQITFDGTNGGGINQARLDTLTAQADSGACNVIAKGRVSGTPRGWLYQGGGQWKSDRAADPLVSTATLVGLAGRGSELTVTGVPTGSGTRMGIDRDRDGFLDGDELAAGSDPGNPASTPNNVGIPQDPERDQLTEFGPNPFHGSAAVSFTLARAGRVELAVYDLMGREVRSLARGDMPAGAQRRVWDGRRGDGSDAPTGVYFVRLVTPGGHWTRTLVRVR